MFIRSIQHVVVIYNSYPAYLICRTLLNSVIIIETNIDIMNINIHDVYGDEQLTS